MTATSVLTAAMGTVALEFRKRGFQRRGLSLVRAGSEVVSLIELQPSTSKTPQKLTFVVNYGVIVPFLFQGRDLTKPIYTDCHWGGRAAGTNGSEGWWAVRETDEAARVAAEITDLLGRTVLPALEGKQCEADLIALWQTGESPLLMEARRLLLLAQLLHRAGRHQEVLAVRTELERIADTPFAIRALEKTRSLGA
jgi:hypothetical protein